MDDTSANIRDTFSKDVESIMGDEFKGEGPIRRLQAGARLHKMLVKYSEDYLVASKASPELLVQAQENLKRMNTLDMPSMNEGLSRAASSYEKYLSGEMEEYGVVDVDVLGMHIALFGLFNPMLIRDNMYALVQEQLKDFYMLLNAGYELGNGDPLATQAMKTMFAAASLTTGRPIY
jgi:hypothetical protein